jgi:hypothetical protein
MAASDYVPIFFKNRLHLAGRPQMGSRQVLPCNALNQNVFGRFPRRVAKALAVVLGDGGAQLTAF